MIEVGDEIFASEQYRFKVTAVKKGKYGILVQGCFPDYRNAKGEGYIIAELPPNGNLVRWYGWWRATTILANGQKVGSVAFRRSDPQGHDTEEYDAEFDRTTATIREEEQGDDKD